MCQIVKKIIITMQKNQKNNFFKISFLIFSCFCFFLFTIMWNAIITVSQWAFTHSKWHRTRNGLFTWISSTEPNFTQINRARLSVRGHRLTYNSMKQGLPQKHTICLISNTEEIERGPRWAPKGSGWGVRAALSALAGDCTKRYRSQQPWEAHALP